MELLPVIPLSLLTARIAGATDTAGPAQAAAAAAPGAAAAAGAAGGPAGARGPGQALSPSFGEILNKTLEEVNTAQIKADQLQLKFLTGEAQDLHQVVIAMEEARLLTSLATEVRNRIVEAYQEISRMQI